MELCYTRFNGETRLLHNAGEKFVMIGPREWAEREQKQIKDGDRITIYPVYAEFIKPDQTYAVYGPDRSGWGFHYGSEEELREYLEASRLFRGALPVRDS